MLMPECLITSCKCYLSASICKALKSLYGVVNFASALMGFLVDTERPEIPGAMLFNAVINILTYPNLT